MTKYIIPGLFSALLCSAAASATTLVFHSSQANQLAAVVYLGNDKLRINSEDGTWILFDRISNTLFIVDDDEQQYYAIDEAQIQSLGQTLGNVNQQIEQALSQLPESQRAQARAMMESMMPGGASQQSAAAEDMIDVSFTGEFDKVADIRCEIVETRVDGRLESELCIADPEEINLSSAEQATLNALGSFAEHMLDTMKENAGNLFPDSLASGSIVKVLETGIPIRMVEQNGTDSSELKSVSHEGIDQALTSIPSQYQQKRFAAGF